MMETELEALKSFFCKTDEFISRQDKYGTQVQINFDLSYILAPVHEDMATNNVGSGLSFCLDKDFPESGPQNIEVQCLFLDDNCLLTLKSNVEKMWSSLGDEASLLEMCCFAQDSILKAVELKRADKTTKHVINFCDQRTCQDSDQDGVSELSCADLNSEKMITEMTAQPQSDDINVISKFEDNQSNDKLVYNSDEFLSKGEASVEVNESFIDRGASVISDREHSRVTAILQFDHMRSKQSYTKLIKKWLSELQLAGRLIFVQKEIFLLLQGCKNAIKEYIVRNRTCNVDVDSRGRSCKERMLSVLAEVPAQGHRHLTNFIVLDDACEKIDLPSLFESYNMGDLYADYLRQFSSQNRRKIVAKNKK